LPGRLRHKREPRRSGLPGGCVASTQARFDSVVVDAHHREHVDGP